MEQETKEKTTTQEITPADVDSTPRFYTSLTDNPVADVVKNNISAYNFIRLKKRITVSSVVPAGGGVAGIKQETVPHKINFVVLPFIYNPVLETLVVVSGVSADAENIYYTLLNFNGTEKTVSTTIFLYELRIK